MNSAFSSIFWTQFWQITLLIPVAVLLIRYVVPKSPHLGYGVLLLVLIKTVFPPVWDSPTGVVWEILPEFYSGAETEQVASAVKISEKTIKQSEPTQKTPALMVESPVPSVKSSASSSQNAIYIKWILLGVWLAGVLSLLGYILGKRAQLLRFHKDTEIPASDDLLELVEVVSAELGLVKIPKVLVTLHPTVPFASGFFKQIVVLPAHIAERSDARELKLILAHEMTHLRRGDTIVGLLQLLVQVVWWFHPLVYWLNREVRRVREECCDSDVVRRLNCQPSHYAHCLLNMLELHQKLRPSTELVGLSPLEVTKKRMQNIMRTTPEERQKTATLFSTMVLISFAFLILPASASSYVTPKVILGDLLPKNAMIVQSQSPEKNKQRQSSGSKKNKRENKKTVKSDENSAKSRETDNKKQSADVDHDDDKELRRMIAALKYQWQRGDRHQYRVKVEAKYPTEIITLNGQPTFRVDAYAAGIPALSLTSSQFTKNVTPIDGVEIPTLDLIDSDNSSASPHRFSPFPTYPFGPPHRAGRSESIRPSGSNRHVDPSSGSLPYLLGQLEDWVFPVLPKSIDKTTQINFQKDLRITNPGVFSLSPFDSEPEERMRANVNIETAVLKLTNNGSQLSRSWHLSTQEKVNGESRREIHLNGKVNLQREDSFPSHAIYNGKLIEREFNREFRIPLTIEMTRLDL